MPVTSITEKRPATPVFHEGEPEEVFLFDVTTFGATMIFEWDPGKNRVNLRKHGLDFADAEQMFTAHSSWNPTRGKTTERSAGEESARFAGAQL
jgi:hypothetical protein